MQILVLANNDIGLYKFRKELLERFISDGHDVAISLPQGDMIPDLQALGCRYILTEFSRRGQRREREKSSVRAKVEHVFAVVKGLFRYRKTRYRGLTKQAAALNMRFSLANLILADRPSLAA